MENNTLNNKLKAFEHATSPVIAPDLYVIARLHKRGITEHKLQLMVDTTEHLMTCGFNVTYAYTELREISLLFDLKENSHERRTDRLLSILSAEASAKLTLLTNDVATFEGRVLALPNKDLVIDYFRSRVSNSNSSSWSYWKGSKKGIRELITVSTGEMIADLMSTN